MGLLELALSAKPLTSDSALLIIINKKDRYSRVPGLSDTRYSAEGTKGK